MADDEFVITREWIDDFRTPARSWTRSQLEAIGVVWPPVHGWKYRVIGTHITQQARQVFESRVTAKAARYGNPMFQVDAFPFLESEVREA